ncbi:MAG TPA: group II intron reverse transcriptase/maturase [Streptosporangiaceae bacterium]|nr:group II intron reverse transcriptase/maturase [Streptosporangiaceae bacterium]
MLEPPEPKGKLDAETVNGPEDEALGWDAIVWPVHEENVRRLRQRIFKATKEQDLATVRNLQRMMLRSWSNTLVSVRQVTQRNAGRGTPGVDGQVALTARARMDLAVQVHRTARSFQPLPVRRVYIPKANGKQRPLGIPAITDRAHQARCRNALEPEWEARFAPRTYGFRPGRSCQDAIAVIHVMGCGKNPRRRWILDADLTAAFDKIDHDHLLAKLGSFPGKGMIRGWLKAGVFEKGKGFAPADEGTPQGGVISPCLLNIALHGLEEAAGVRYEASDPARTKRGCPALVIYADDMVALCHTRQQAERVKARMAGWLAPRGLSFNEAKTRIVTLEDGFDFLGFTVRRHSGKLITRPSKAAVKRVKHRLAAEMRALRGGNAAAVLATINPIVRGWANYYRGAASSRTFAALDHYLWQLTYKWACHSHANKPKPWIVSRYYGRFNPASQDRWVFGNRDNGAYLPRLGWTKIVRHSLVVGAASPDDPALTGYWARRRRKNQPLLDRSVLILLARQKGRCPLCRDLLLHADHEPSSPTEWEQWHRVTRKAITKQYVTTQRDTGTPGGTRLVHSHCQRRATGASKEPAHLYA